MSEALLPHDLEAERALLGSLILDRDAIIPVSQIVSSGDFYSPANATIYTAIKSLFRNRVPADVVTVKAELDKFGQTDAVGGISYLTELMIDVPASVHAGFYADMIVQHASRRRLIQHATRIVQQAYDPTNDPADVVSEARRLLADVAPASTRGNATTMADAIDAVMHEWELRLTGEWITDAVPTGFYDLDRKLPDGGFERQDLVIFAARPGMGKTALMLQMALNVNRHYLHTNQHPPTTVIFTSEMSTRALCWRALAEATGIPSRDLKRPGALTEQQQRKVRSQMAELAELSIVFEDASSPTTEQMKERIEQVKAENDVRLVMFDYIERAGNRKSGNENEENRIAQVAAGLKTIAKDCDVTMVALSQLNREVERRAGHVPTLADLRQSGRIEQEADFIGALVRHDYYVSIGLEKPDVEQEGIAEIHILKMREGEQGILRLQYVPEITAFRNLDRSRT